jgi:hypothetical protein
LVLRFSGSAPPNQRGGVRSIPHTQRDGQVEVENVIVGEKFRLAQDHKWGGGLMFEVRDGGVHGWRTYCLMRDLRAHGSMVLCEGGGLAEEVEGAGGKMSVIDE